MKKEDSGNRLAEKLDNLDKVAKKILESRDFSKEDVSIRNLKNVIKEEFTKRNTKRV